MGQKAVGQLGARPYCAPKTKPEAQREEADSEMAKQRKNKQNLRGQIMGGYTRVIFCICILGLLTIGFLGALFWNYQTLDQMEQNRLEIQHAPL